MSQKKLKTALIGLDDDGLNILEALLKVDSFDLLAIADKNTKLAEKIAAIHNCDSYDDYRQLIAQNQLDCLIVTGGIHRCDEYVKSAIKNNVNILKLAPAARNFEETVEFYRLAKSNKVRFTVANTYRFAKSFLMLDDFLRKGSLEQISVINALCCFADKKHPMWQTDPKLSGGGVLLHNCYGVIDEILKNTTLPQQVYAVSTNYAPDRKQRLLLTEDVVSMTMKFGNTVFANIVADKNTGEKIQLKIHSKDRIVTVTNSQFSIADKLSRTIEKVIYNDTELSRTVDMLNAFALSILSPQKNKFPNDISQDLKNMAVIEAAYLSARTSMPEQPERIMQMSQLEPELIWPTGKRSED
ncbi:MAG TPA: Gfo/Idh/MocA family oxidoreductase [Sedimentisphaerales bacterium]|nr:Gfo/Idh/MocA family oxidoreductase [Sedimentisphaerales bacterium]